MFYIILLILLALLYIFLMPKDIRRSLDVFVLVGIGVLIVSIGIAQAALNQTLLLEILMIVAAFALTVKAWFEVAHLDKGKRRNNSRRNKRRK